MAVNEYDFSTQFKRGERGETFLDAYFRQMFHIEDVTREGQRKGTDRWFTPLPFGQRFLIDYKTDYAAHKTGNGFIETVSVDTTHKPGWIFTSQAAYIIYYVAIDEIIYVLPMRDLRERLPRWQRDCRLVKVPNVGYCTHGLLVDLCEFERLSIYTDGEL